MSWNILFYESGRGEKPVEGFVKSLDELTIAKIIHSIDLLEKFGPLLGMPHVKKLDKNLYELRTRGKQEIRILFSFDRKKIYLLHAFQKKTQKTPSKEIDTALKRLKTIR